MLKNRGHLPKRRYLTRNYIKIGVKRTSRSEDFKSQNSDSW